MNTNNKTLADVQPGGRVRLGDALPPLPASSAHCPTTGEPLFSASKMTVYAQASVQAALSAQPSPGGLGDLKSRFTEWVKANSYNPATFASGRFMGDGVQIAWEAVQALAARQPVGEPEIWVSPGQLEELKRRPAGQGSNYLPTRLASEGNFTQPLYAAPPAQAVDLGQLKRFELFADEGPGLGGMSVDYEESDTGAWVRFDDVRALIDSRDSHHG